MKKRIIWMTVGTGMLVCAGQAQVPDLLNALDVGTRTQGAGGALNGAANDTTAAYYNPAALAYLQNFTVTVARRNLPDSRSVVGGTYNDQVRTTRVRNGTQNFTHVGYAFPASQLRRGASGTLAVSYSVGGYVNDRATGPGNANLPLGSGLFIQGFTEDRRVKTEFVNISYGRTNANGNLAIGYGLVIANQNFRFRQTGTLVDSSGDPISPGPSPITFPDTSTQGTGIGLLLGFQLTPTNDPNRQYFGSVQTPIQLNKSGNEAASLRRIPGRVLLGGAQRLNGFRRGSDDFLVIAAQGQLFFGGQGTGPFRRTNQTTGGVGAEYSLDFGDFRLPLRVGFNAISTGGGDTTSRNGITYGLGFSPKGGRSSFDINWFRPRTGGLDTYITATYRF